MDESAAVGEKKAFSFPLKMYTTINSFQRGSWSFSTQILDSAQSLIVSRSSSSDLSSYEFESQQRQYLSIKCFNF